MPQLILFMVGALLAIYAIIFILTIAFVSAVAVLPAWITLLVARASALHNALAPATSQAVALQIIGNKPVYSIDERKLENALGQIRRQLQAPTLWAIGVGGFAFIALAFGG